MICSLSSLLQKAQNGKYAVGAFNVLNLEFALGIVRAAEKEHAPVILQISPSVIQFFGMSTILLPCLDLAKNSSTQVCVHLDHGKTEEIIQQAIVGGFSSVMFDGSSLAFQDNLEKTSELTKMAHAMNSEIEAEIGKVGKNEDEKGEGDPFLKLTNIDEAATFAKITQIDAMAISIGSIHGIVNQTISLNLDLLQNIREKVSTPLVLHGSSGVKDDSIQKAIQLGITKINVATRLKKKVAFFLENISIQKGLTGLIDTTAVSGLIVDAVQSEASDRIRLFGSSHRSH